MAEEPARRRLAAILAVAAVGYCRVMERGDLGTLSGPTRCRKDVLEPVIDKHQGRGGLCTSLSTHALGPHSAGASGKPWARSCPQIPKSSRHSAPHAQSASTTPLDAAYFDSALPVPRAHYQAYRSISVRSSHRRRLPTLQVRSLQPREAYHEMVDSTGLCSRFDK